MRRVGVADAARRDDHARAHVDAGAFTPPGAAQALAALPAFCRVAATLKPSSDSDIKIEVWMPAAGLERQVPGGRQRRLQRHHPLCRDAAALARGYATSATDTGHAGGSASLALGHPEKVDRLRLARGPRDDGGLQADHRALLRRGPRFSYWNGCSAGGRQAMKEAQRFPADFDGIIAGAPGLDWTGARGAGGARRASRWRRPSRAPVCRRTVSSCTRPWSSACDAWTA